MVQGLRPQPRDGKPHGLAGSNQANMRAHNERLVLTLIRRHGPTAKADIARATGLSAQTVSVIMRQLETDGLLVKGEPVRGRVGQPSVPMALAADGAYFLGLMIDRRVLDLVVTDFLGEIIAREQRTHSHPLPDATQEFVAERLPRVTRALPARHRSRIAGMGLAMPFRLWDWADPLGVPQKEMDAWRDADLREALAAQTRYPVLLQNDATAACAAELVFGQAEMPADFLYFYVGYFIGGGVVLNGGLYSGRRGNAGALGSLPVPLPDGRSGQLIDVASLSGLTQRLTAAGHDTAAVWGDPLALPEDEAVLAPWIEEAAAGLAHAIAAAVSVIDVETVLIDGWIPSSLRERLVAATCGQLGRVNLAGLSAPDIREGTIGPNARTLGAASLPLSERFLVEPNALSRTG